VFVQLTILFLAGLAGPLLSWLGMGVVPVVIGELLAGIALGNTGAGVIDPSVQPLPAFSAIGFAMLMLTAGTRVDIGSREIRRGLVYGLVTFAVVAAAAVPMGLLVDRSLGIGKPALLAVLIAGSSAAIVFPVIEEQQLHGRGIAALISWIALADFVTVVLMPLTLAGGANLGLALGGDAAVVAATVLVLALARPLRARRATRDLQQESRERGWGLQLRVSVLLLLGLSAIAQRTGASTLLAGFAAGIVIAELGEPRRLALQLIGLANGFFVPLFFVLLGAQLNLRALAEQPSLILLAVALAAAALASHIAAAAVSRQKPPLASGLTASAQLGLPAAAASLGLSTHLLSGAAAAALVTAGCLTLAPAAIGARMLARTGEPAKN